MITQTSEPSGAGLDIRLPDRDDARHPARRLDAPKAYDRGGRAGMFTIHPTGNRVLGPPGAFPEPTADELERRILRAAHPGSEAKRRASAAPGSVADDPQADAARIVPDACHPRAPTDVRTGHPLRRLRQMPARLDEAEEPVADDDARAAILRDDLRAMERIDIVRAAGAALVPGHDPRPNPPRHPVRRAPDRFRDGRNAHRERSAGPRPGMPRMTGAPAAFARPIGPAAAAATSIGPAVRSAADRRLFAPRHRDRCVPCREAFTEGADGSLDAGDASLAKGTGRRGDFGGGPICRTAGRIRLGWAWADGAAPSRTRTETT